MKFHTTRLAILAASLLALPACSDRSSPFAPEAPALKRSSGGAAIAGTVSGTATRTITTAAGTVTETGSFSGTATVLSLATNAAGDILATLRIVGTATFATGTVAVTETVTEVAQARRRCPILELDVGAIRLDLLGLVIDLSPINLDIIAESGPGKLLGNLLCALVGLLDGAGSAGAIAEILNQINAILAGF